MYEHKLSKFFVAIEFSCSGMTRARVVTVIVFENGYFSIDDVNERKLDLEKNENVFVRCRGRILGLLVCVSTKKSYNQKIKKE